MRKILAGILVLALGGNLRADDTVAVSERLAAAAKRTRDLFAAANVVAPAQIERLAIYQSAAGMRFAHPADPPLYLQARPWSITYTFDYHDFQGERRWPGQSWPTETEAPALRVLLSDKDPAFRAMAIEALTTLDLAEDAARIARLLDDKADAPPVLHNCSTWLDTGIPSEDLSPAILFDQAFYPRTVAGYARDALEYLTTIRFATADEFQQWAKTHDIGRNSLWYWQARVAHLHPSWTWETSQPQPLASLFHTQYVKEIQALDAETEAKIFLLGGAGSGIRVENPFAPYFATADVRLRISRQRIMELLALKNLWPDVEMTRDRTDLLIARIAFLAPALLPREDWPAVRAAASTSLNSCPPLIFVSRLLPPGDNIRDVQTREGYLEKVFAEERETYRREDMMREMLRTNPALHLPAIEAAFYAETQQSALPTFRAALLRETGTAPLLPWKRELLLRLINDPRNDALFTQASTSFDSASYRVEAAVAVNSWAGRQLISDALLRSLVGSAPALAEFRRLANSFAAPATAPAP